MQPIGPISNTIASTWTASLQTNSSPDETFHDLWQAAVREAEAIAQAERDSAVAHDPARLANARASLESVSRVCEGLLAAFHEIRDLKF